MLMRKTMRAVGTLALSLALAGCAGPVATTGGETTSAQEQTAQQADDRQTEAEQGAPDFSEVQVSYLGPEGTYTQEACGVFFGGQGTYLPMDDVAASVQALLDGSVDYAVIPQENTIGGPIAEYLDEVVTHEEVCVVGEVELPISQNLLVKPGVALEDIHTVYSHKQGIAQGSAWLEEHLPNAEVVEVSSTAEGAKMASEAEAGDCAAIGSAAAADVYGLEVVADNIQQNDANKTRFYVLGTGEPAEGPSDRMAFLASGDATDLAELLASAEAQGLEVVAVHDRPEKTELGRYTYLVECAGGDANTYAILAEENPAFELRYLGSFEVLVPSTPS